MNYALEIIDSETHRLDENVTLVGLLIVLTVTVVFAFVADAVNRRYTEHGHDGKLHSHYRGWQAHDHDDPYYEP